MGGGVVLSKSDNSYFCTCAKISVPVSLTYQFFTNNVYNMKISLKELETFVFKTLVLGVSLENFKAVFEQAKNSISELCAEADKAYTLADLKKKIYSAYGKKGDYVTDYVEALLCKFHVFPEMFSYSWTYGQNTDNIKMDALCKSVEKTTQADLDAYRDRKAAAAAERRRIIETPSTLEDFELHLRAGNRYESWPAEWRTSYDALKAAKIRQEEEKEAAKRATVTAAKVEGLSGEIIETKHTKKGHNLFVVQMSKRVERDEYNSINVAAKRLGGYYSSFTGGGAVPGFQFTERADAEQFLRVLSGEKSDGAAAVAERKEERTENVKNKFFQMAERLESAGTESLNADRKSNTHRRANMAANAEREAMDKIRWAGILRRLGERLDAGTLLGLDKVTALTQLKDLDLVLRQGHYSRMRAENVPYSEQDSTPFDLEKTFPHMATAFYGFWRETVLEIAMRNRRTAGNKMRCDRLISACNNATGQKVYFRNASDVIHLIEKDRHDGLQYEVDRVKRLRAAGISENAQLRQALREFVEIRDGGTGLSEEQAKMLADREIERQFIGKDIPGFFPTPPALVSAMLEKVSLFEGCEVLEPSAGLGHIIAQVLQAEPSANVSWCEVNYSLQEALLKRFPETTQAGTDFLEMPNDPKFDFILMNPPFEDRQDETHVRKAYELLKHGGTLVAICANREGQRASGPFFGWIDEVGGYWERNPDGAFTSSFRPTGVNTIMVTICK